MIRICYSDQKVNSIFQSFGSRKAAAPIQNKKTDWQSRSSLYLNAVKIIA
tara:strand:+ start:378 stop:527 length:150 start_codon:yes stop_codon:yes gene_type:complete